MDMFWIIQSYLWEHKQVLEPLPGALMVFARFTERLRQVEKLWYQFSKPITSVAFNKKLAREALEAETLEINDILTAYALISELEAMAKELDRIPIRLPNQSADEMIKRAGTVLKYFTEHEEALAPWNFPTDKRTGFAERIDAFRNRKTSPRLAIEARSETKKQAQTIMEEIKKDLKIMDKLLSIVGRTNPWFTRLYQRHRKPRKKRKTTMSVMCRVLVADTLEPTVGALVKPSFGNRTYKVTPTGLLLIRNAPQGEHNLTISYPGLPDTVVRIFIIDTLTNRETFLLGVKEPV